LGASDDEDDVGEAEITNNRGLGQLAKLVQPSTSVSVVADPTQPEGSSSANADLVADIVFGAPKRKQKRKKGSSKRPSPWADQCMYAELLEMSEDKSRMPMDKMPESDGVADDGLPVDLESAWVAVAPVPAGKRCLAICHQGSGAVGVGASFPLTDERS
jgi:snurportin-1